MGGCGRCQSALKCRGRAAFPTLKRAALLLRELSTTADRTGTASRTQRALLRLASVQPGVLCDAVLESRLRAYPTWQTAIPTHDIRCPVGLRHNDSARLPCSENVCGYANVR